MEIIDALVIQEEKLEEKFQLLEDSFELAIQKTTSYRNKAILINGKKDFHNHRFSFLKKMKKIKNCNWVEILIQEVSDYLDLKDQFDKSQNDYSEIFSEEVNRQFSSLVDFFKKPSFQKGLLQSSHIVYHQAEKLIDKDPQTFRKKERQTLKTLSQYFYRIATKTSPFNYFTTLDLLSNQSGTFINDQAKQESVYYQYNNFILAEMKKLLLTDKLFFEQLNLSINPSYHIHETELIFIRNERNIESVQEMENNEFLELIIKILRVERLSFKNLVNELLQNVDATKDIIENYLLDLIASGFVEWDWSFSGLSYSWEENLLQKIKSLDVFFNREKWIGCLEYLISIKKELVESSVSRRLEIQQSIKRELEVLGMKDIVVELIFFEDVQKNSLIKIEEDNIIPIVDSLNALLYFLHPISENNFGKKIKQCWIENFEQKKSIPLVIFYKRFFEKHNNINAKNKNEEKSNELKRIIEKIKQEGKDGSLKFFTKDFPNPAQNNKNLPQYCGLFHFFNNEQSLNAMISGLTTGYGKFFGRFLPLFSKEITIELQEWNAKTEEHFCLVENVDGSVFNANLHPPLLNYEVNTANSQNNLPKESQISINEIFVEWDENLDQPILINSNNKKQVVIVDFGFEHPENRAPMYQLLNGFSRRQSSYKLFLEIVNNLFEPEQDNEITNLKKITLDNHLVLQRKAQVVPTTFFPKKEKNETDSIFFYKIQKWRKNHNFPRYIFIRPIPPNDFSDQKQNKDFYKPHFIDLESPIAIILLHKIISNCKGKIKIEEMFPDHEEMIGGSVSEFGVQWKN